MLSSIFGEYDPFEFPTRFFLFKILDKGNLSQGYFCTLYHLRKYTFFSVISNLRENIDYTEHLNSIREFRIPSPLDKIPMRFKTNGAA